MKHDDHTQINIRISKHLMQDVQRFLKDYDFDSIEELIVFLLNETVKLYKENKTKDITPHDDAKRKETLKDLGYI